MNIRVTDEAKSVLHKSNANNKNIIRISGTMTNSCSIFVDVDLIFDEYNPNEVVYEDEQIIIQMDDFKKEYIGDKLTLAYKTTGFSITTPSETLVYGLSIKK